MPAPKKSAPAPVEYRNIRTSCVAAMREANDCAVISVSIATGVPYDQVHAHMERLGRKPRQGTPLHVIERTINDLGFRFLKVTGDAFMDAHFTSGYAAKRRPNNLTTHHPERFKDVWPKGVQLLLHPRHILAVKDGVVQDWSQGRVLRITHVYHIVKA